MDDIQKIMADNSTMELNAQAILSRKCVDYVNHTIHPVSYASGNSEIIECQRRYLSADGRLINQQVLKNINTGVMREVDSVISHNIKIKNESGNILYTPNKFLN